jgi:hypothetical protein
MMSGIIIRQRASAEHPCPVCHRTKSCSISDTGVHFCRDVTDAQAERHIADGWIYLGPDRHGAFGRYVRPGGSPPPGASPRGRTPEEAEAIRQAKEEAREQKLEEWRTVGKGRDARPLQKSTWTIQQLRRKFPAFSEKTYRQVDILDLPKAGRFWTIGIPEVDGAGKTIGYAIRNAIGDKWFAGGRGLTVPRRVRCKREPDLSRGLGVPPVYAPEGATDVLAFCEMGLDSIGRPNNIAGAEMFAEWIKAHLPRSQWNIIVVAEHDRRIRNGVDSWPGRDGAWHFAHQLARLLGITVRVAYPPSDCKDVRDFLEKEIRRKGMDAGKCGRQLADFLAAHAYPVHSDAPSPLFTSLADRAPVNLLPITFDDLTILGQIAAQARQMQDATFAACAERYAALFIRMARRDLARFRCSRPRAILLADTWRHDNPFLQTCRCQQCARCDGCRRSRIHRELVNATLRFNVAGDGSLWEGNVTAEDWPRLQRWLNRRGVEYHRTAEDCRRTLWYVVVNAKPPDRFGFIPVPAAQAISTVQTLLNDYREHPRPVSTSHGWKLPQLEERSDRFRLVGSPSFLPGSLFCQIVSAFGCCYSIRHPLNEHCNTIRGIYANAEHLPPSELARLYESLIAGEEMPAVELVPAGPPDPYDGLGDPFPD